jgi:peptidoglycan hydrolase-like protein with peptidoglycan-binding domain
VLVVAGVAAAVALTPLATASSPLPVPKPVVKLPATAEALAPYVPQDSCDPVAKPGVVAFRALMLATYKRGTDGGIVRGCDVGATSEHKEGRAWDWMLDVHDQRDAAVASAVLQFLLSPGPHGEPAWNARRFGIMYIIWDGQIWGAYRPSDGWRPYTGTSEHTDHIHFSFSWAGAWKRTSWWTGKVAAVDYGPCRPATGGLAPVYRAPNPTPCPGQAGGSAQPAPPVFTYAKPGETSAHVRVVQIKLGVRPVTGFFGARTQTAVKAYQTDIGLRATGVVDGWTAFRMHLGPNPSPPPVKPPPAPYAKPGDTSPKVRVVQTKLSVRPATGYFGVRTLAAVKAYQKRLHLPQTGVVSGWTAYRLGVGPNPAPPPPPAPYAAIGDLGTKVRAVQGKLAVRPVDGIFGLRTVAAVRAFQQRVRLPATGTVDAWTAWRLGLGARPKGQPPTVATAKPPAAVPPYARPGDHGARVLAVQHALAVRPATGFYGPVTAAAVRAFQARAHLPVTGVVDHTTAVRLRLVRG